jgi:CDP-glucose 4,6-dehydratase
MLLSSLGAEVTGYALKPPTSPSLFEAARVADLVKSIEGDIRNLDKLYLSISESKPDIVIHMAAQPIVRLSYKDPVLTYDTNVMGTVNLLESIRKQGNVRAVINVTTDKCYENKEWYWGYRENETLGGFDPYSNSKACSEIITSSFRNSFFNNLDYGKKHKTAIASARAGNVIGGGDWAEDRLIPDIIRSLLCNGEIIIRSPNSVRPWQYVLEPLSGYLLLAKNLYEKGTEYAEAWNFGPEELNSMTVEGIVKLMCKFWGNDAHYTIDLKQQLHEAKQLRLDISKAKQRLGWAPMVSLEETIKGIIKWTTAWKKKENIQKVCFNQIKIFDLKSEDKYERFE